MADAGIEAQVRDYLDAEVGQELFGKYTEIIAGAARLIDNADAWVMS